MVSSVFRLFVLAGAEWVLWLLVALSVLVLAVVFDRWRQLRNQERVGSALWRSQLQTWLRQGVPGHWKTEAEKLPADYPCLEADLLAYLAKQPLERASSEKMELLAQGFLSSRKLDLEKNLAILGTLGNNAPFIGLLGTVIGIVRAFHDLGGKAAEGNGGGGVAMLSSGLAEALVTTAVGLMVALPAVIFYNFFSRKIKTIMARAESLSDVVVGSSGHGV